MAKNRSIKVISQSCSSYKATPTLTLKGQWLKVLGVEGLRVVLDGLHCRIVNPHISLADTTMNERGFTLSHRRNWRPMPYGSFCPLFYTVRAAMLHDRLNQYPASHYNLPDTCFFLFIEIEIEHISGLQTIRIQILQELFLAASVVRFTPPQLHLNHELLPAVIHHYIRPLQIPGACLDVIISRAVYDRF